MVAVVRYAGREEDTGFGVQGSKKARPPALSKKVRQMVLTGTCVCGCSRWRGPGNLRVACGGAGHKTVGRLLRSIVAAEADLLHHTSWENLQEEGENCNVYGNDFGVVFLSRGRPF